MASRIILLRGIVGSTAYGLAREGSDEDRLGVYAWPTDSFFHLGEPKDSVVKNKPDITEHELAKYLRLALKCNPSLLELLWLPQDLYQVRRSQGTELIALRKAFLHTTGIRNAYGGYALQQAQRLQRREAEGKEGFSSTTRNRTAKHARHCFRLLEQGQQLLETGDLTVKVPDPEMYWAFDGMSVEQIVARFEASFAKFNAIDSVLPDQPDFMRVDMFLYRTRKKLL